jgi:hypothetical protein
LKKSSKQLLIILASACPDRPMPNLAKVFWFLFQKSTAFCHVGFAWQKHLLTLTAVSLGMWHADDVGASRLHQILTPHFG